MLKRATEIINRLTSPEPFQHESDIEKLVDELKGEITKDRSCANCKHNVLEGSMLGTHCGEFHITMPKGVFCSAWSEK
jgi:hypothetical protein